MAELEGKVAVITGGASGIGESAARLFVAEGASVVIADMQKERGTALAEELGSKAVFAQVEVRQEAEVKAAVDMAVDTWGRLDCMFNNAGFGGVLGPVEEIPVDDFDMTMDVLVRGVFLGMKHAVPVMKKQQSGSIINTGSIAGVTAGRGPIIYSAA
ncbi:MAG: SDR family NAD(P)-dependent oxidoreductase, partial [Rhodospirillaceae bacterium]|nr:SDR family NAD(P)-dependent oxidoreductase [Rhodospirillaceae bacterium]